MKCNFVIITFVLLVLKANILSGSQRDWLKRTKRDYKFDEKGHPVWPSAIPKYDYKFNKEGHPIWPSAVQTERPRSTAETTTTKINIVVKLQTELPTTTVKKSTTTTTTERNIAYSVFDKLKRPIWGFSGNVTGIGEKRPPKTTEKATVATTENTNFPMIITEEERRIMRAQNITNATSITKFGKKVATEENPCEKEPPELKNSFSAPGKRKALEKCDEYKEEERYKLQMKQFEADCIAYNDAHNITNVNVVNGEPAQQGEYPHMAALGWETILSNYDFKCGGILISSNFVLTAAHCTMVKPDTNLVDLRPKVVRFGDKNIRDENVKHENRIDEPISDIIKHKLFKPPAKYNDIALIKLEKDVLFNADVRPACLWHQFDTTSLGTRAIVTGWGRISSFSFETSSNLLYAELDLVDNEICNDKLWEIRSTRKLKHGIQNTQICAGEQKGGVDTCQGDSGGPMQVLKKEEEVSVYYVIGVTSFGNRCGAKDVPGVYTRVSSYLDWIESCVWDDISSPSCQENSTIML